MLFFISRLLCLLALIVASVFCQCPNNPHAGKDVRAAGDWSELPLWNHAEPKGLMTYDPVKCEYYHAVCGLRPNKSYKWKVTIGNSWNSNYGCTNNADCEFVSSASGEIRFIFKPSTNQLSTDLGHSSCSVNLDLVCLDKFSGKSVRAVGEWNNWVVVESQNLMRLDTNLCEYVLPVIGLTANKLYDWKVVIGDTWAESYGCNNGGNCKHMTSNDGGLRYRFNEQNQLLADFETTGGVTHGSTIQPVETTPAPIGPTVNPITECTSSCPTCTNSFASKLIRATGDWTIDAGSTILWSANETRGLMTFDFNTCYYELVLVGLKPNFQYNWKVTINNAFTENYGCSGLNGPNCGFKSSDGGTIRLRMLPSSNPPQLINDYNTFPCGDGICQVGQTCRMCPEDCGECPPPVCGDGICEEGQTFLNCSSDCPNELPGCDRFNDESCRSGSQISANDGVAKRRWQTPRPGQKGYLPSFQDQHSLVGHADIRYTSTQRNEADVCIIAIHRNPVTLTYYFNNEPQAANCRRFTSAFKTSVALRVTGSDGTRLDIAAVDLWWNAEPLLYRPGDFRNGQKGAVVELFGWPHKDVESECEIIAKAGYLGVKLFPVHEQLMSTQPFEDVMNPWYFMYQPVSYKLDGRMGTREELQSLIKKCRSLGLRVYVDIILNHMTGAGNDLHEHRNPGAGCTKWGNKTSSAPLDRQSPFYSHAYTYQYNPNSGEPPSNEFPGASLGPDDFHCERSLNSWSDLFLLNNGWLVGLIDIDTSKENVRERQAAYVVELLSMGISGFRIDAAKHISPDDMSKIFKKIQQKMGGEFPADFFMWLEVLTGGESGLLWTGPSWYGTSFQNTLLADLGSWGEVNKIKMWDGLYPKEPGNNPLISKHRVVIQNDDHDQQSPGSSSRDMGPFGCVLVKNCPINDHRNFEINLFKQGSGSNGDDWPIRFILSSYYFTHGMKGIPDGLSTCSLCKVTCETCRENVPKLPAYEPNVCGYAGTGYTRCHRDIAIINEMRRWVSLGGVSGADIGLPGCN